MAFKNKNYMRDPVLRAADCKGITVRRHSFLLSAAIAALFCTAGGMRAASAQVASNGNVTPGTLSSPIWTVGTTGTDELNVGNTATGDLTISAGGSVINGDAYVGRTNPIQGTVIVSGSGGGNVSTWASSGQVVIGEDGNGTLQIDSGGMASTSMGIVGHFGSAVGAVTVSGNDGVGHASSWLVGGELDVGDQGNGAMTVSGGGFVNNGGDGYVGGAGSGVGIVTVSGSGGGAASTWTHSGRLNIGYDGNGTLHIDSGGAVSSGSAILGFFSGGEDGAIATGNVTVSGSGGGRVSTWLINGGLDVGYAGTGAMTILGGGFVSSTGGSIGSTTISATISSSTGVGTVIVSGSDGNGHASTWMNSGTLVVGNVGTGTLQVDDGGLVRSDFGFIGSQAGSTGHATVSDAGSAWNLTSTLYVGDAGVGDLQVLNGGTASAAFIYIGNSAGGQGTVTVSSGGADTSTLSASTSLVVGANGSGTLTIGQGGLVHAGSDVQIANSLTSTGTIHLDGTTSGRGILETGAIFKGAGAATLDLNGGILRATGNASDFLSGFTTLTVGAEGAWVDTGIHDVAISTAFTGTSSFNKLGQGTLTLTADSSTFTGNTVVQEGTLQVDGKLGGPTEVLLDARLSGMGQVGITTNRGTIAPGNSGSFGTLTIAGNYTSAGGGLEIKSQLGDDSSPTDRLVIMGSTSGATGVTLLNVGGVGAQTQQGIQVVQVNGASNGQFNLANGNYVINGHSALIAGAYGYVLEKDAADGDWYLRSSATAASGPVPPGSPGSPGTPSAPGAPGAPTPPDAPSAPGSGGASAPLYQPGVPVYEAYANTLLSLSGVPTLHQRAGSRSYDAADRDHDGVWGRVEGKSSHLAPSFSTSGSSQNIDSWQAQFGVDRILSGEADGARVVGGLTARYGVADTHASSIFGDGDIDTKAYGVGASLTWYGAQGAYVDAQAQATLFRSDLSSRLAGGLASGQTGRGYAMSVEAGKALPIRAGLSLVPQAQLSYVASSFGFQDRFDTQVDSDKAESMQGRLGLALDYQRNWRNAAGQARQQNFYGVINLKREFLDGTRITVSGTSFDNRLGRTWAGLGVGTNYAWGERYAFYGEVTADSNLDGSHSVSATAGFRMRF